MKTKTRRLLIAADGSESAAACWSETQAAIGRLLDQLDPQIVPDIGILGTGELYTRERWGGTTVLTASLGQKLSLIAPVIKASQPHLDEIVAVVIVGSGAVYDLVDWVRRPEAWFLLQTGSSPLASAHGGLLNFGVEQIEPMISKIGSLHGAAITWPNPSINGQLGQKWALDPAGYPMVLVPPLKGFVHLFPVLHAQFEVFLAHACPENWRDEKFDQYLSGVIPRVAASLATPENYEGVFMGGTLPEDVAAFQSWCGPAFRSLTDREWQIAWSWFANAPACLLPYELEDELEPSAREFFRFVFENFAPQTLLDVSWMRAGMIEWAKTSLHEWVGMGKPRQVHPFHNPLTNPPLRPTSLTLRSRWFGFRLMRKAA